MNQAYPHHIITKVDKGMGDDGDQEDDMVGAAIRRFDLGDPDDLGVGYT